MSSRYELVKLEKALAEKHIGAAIARAEKAAEDRFSYLLKANVFNYSDFFIGTPGGDVRSLILQVNDYLNQKLDGGHLLLANIDGTADGFWAYLFQKYKKKKKQMTKFELLACDPVVQNDVKNLLAVKTLLLKHERYLSGQNLFATQRAFQAADLFVRNMQFRKLAHESIRGALKDLLDKLSFLREVDLPAFLDAYLKRIIGAGNRRAKRLPAPLYDEQVLFPDYLPEDKGLH